MSNASATLVAASTATAALDLPYDITANGDTGILRDESGNISLKSACSAQGSQDPGQRLALITVDNHSISFEANVDGFTITPPSAETLSRYHDITVPPSTKEHRWSTVLRPDDTIRFSDGAAEFDLILKIEDRNEVEVTSSIQQSGDGMEDEVPETQERPSMSAPSVSNRRTEKRNTNRTTVQVEQSMQGSNTLRSTPPSRNTQQSLVVEETPATNRNIALTGNSESNAAQQDTVDMKEFVSTDVSTPTAVKDSFADRPKNIQAEQTIPSLELGSLGRSDMDAEEETTASEDDDEDDEDQMTENPDFSAAPEDRKSQNRGQSATPKAPSSVSTPLNVMDDVKDTTPLAADEEINLDQAAEAEEVMPKAESKRQLRTRPQPEVRIPPSRSKKRSPPDETPSNISVKKSRTTKGKEQAQSQDSLASSIKIRVEKPPASIVPTPSTERLKAVSERTTPAASQTSFASQSPRRSASSSVQVHSPFRGKSPRVAFSNTSMSENVNTSKFLKKQGVQTADKVTEKGCDIVCIGLSNGTYVKSAKLLLGLAFGKPIVSYDWVVKSREAGRLLEVSYFPPLHAPDEWLWGGNEEDVNQALTVDRSTLFKGNVFFVTPALKKEYAGGYADLERIIKAAGAKVVSKSARDYKHTDDTIILASENSDLEGMALMGADKDEDGYQLYTKDLVSMSVIRGALDLDSEEFKIKQSSSQSKRERAVSGRKRKGG
ncbi:BRCT domain-containing protein [Botryosphaeria dothidea]|uniref:BRCT domain-containing protein n=1 Tax=Botryosphaeria dothidea TaxID=55169 RepID=A0A8H4IMR6_9PEZI|nr:BRCT domain-containing protein [Botryosphaeria dothidea]